MTNGEIPTLAKNADNLLLSDPLEFYKWLASFLNQFEAIATQLNIPEIEVVEVRKAIHLQMRIAEEQIEANDRKCAAEFLLAQKRKELSQALYENVLA